MPKATFFNLLEEKRNRIMDAAIDEFSQHEYSDVTVSAIVKQSGIPKGSFYQYFEDKFDLYYYIVGLVGEKKQSYFTPVVAAMTEGTFFEIMSAMYKAGILFASENPKLSAIGTILMRSSDKELVNKIYGNMSEGVDCFLNPILSRAVENGEIRDDIDLKLLSYMFSQFNLITAEYFFHVKNGENFEEYVRDIDVMLDVFKNGIKKRS